MGGMKSTFLVLLFLVIIIVLLTVCGISLSDSILKNHVLRGDNDTLTVPRPKTAKQVTNITEIWKEQKLRLNRIKTVCERLNRTPSFTPPRHYTTRLLVNEHDKVLFGFIPKVGCTTWKGVFSRARKAYRERTYGRLSNFDQVEREKRLRTYKKVLFVRDPIIRLLSGYLGKFTNLGKLQKIWEKSYGFKILKLYRPGSEKLLKTAQSLPSAKRPFLNVTLTEWIRFITYLGDKYILHEISDHWLPQHIVSHVCDIPYDFIGKYENLASEAPFMLNWVGMSSVVQYPEVHESRAAANLAEGYSSVPLRVIEDLRKYYSLDFELFDYDSTKSIAKVTRDIFNINILES